MFSRCSRPVVLAGGGVHLSGAYQQLEHFRSTFHVPVATTVNGKGSVAETLHNAVGVIGANGGSEEGLNIVQQADLVLVLGSKLNAVTTMGKIAINKEAKVVQVDIGEDGLGLNIDVDVPLVGDIRTVLEALNAAMAAKKDAMASRFDAWNQWVCRKISEKRARIEAEMRADSALVLPARFFGELERLTGENTIFAGDAGTPTPYISVLCQAEEGRQMERAAQGAWKSRIRLAGCDWRKDRQTGCNRALSDGRFQLRHGARRSGNSQEAGPADHLR